MLPREGGRAKTESDTKSARNATIRRKRKRGIRKRADEYYSSGLSVYA